MAYHLEHRDKLLSDLADGMGNQTIERTRTVSIRVRLFVGREMVKEYLGLQPAIDALANDLYWDDEGEWADADRLEVDTY